MSAAPATAGRNLVGVLGLAAFAAVLYYGLKSGDGWLWFQSHPGAITAVLAAGAVQVAVAVWSGRVLLGLGLAVAVAALLYGVPSIRASTGALERPLLKDHSTGAPR